MKFSRMFDCVETHSGEPMRVITGGIPKIPGATVYEKMCYLRDHDPQVRNLLEKEPRAYPPYCTDILVPATDPRADVGVIIIEPCGYPLVSGSNMGAVVTTLLETGMLPMQYPYTDVVLEAPGGLIQCRAKCEGDKVKEVTYTNAPCFVPYIDTPLDVPGVGAILVDIAYSGMWYVHADIGQFEKLGIDLTNDYARQLTQLSAKLILAASEQITVKHPDFTDPRDNIVNINFMTKALDDVKPSRHCVNAVTIVTEGNLSWDKPESLTGTLARDASGTGGAAMVAIEYFKGNLGLHEKYINQSLCGIQNTLEIIGTTKVGEYDAVIPNVTNQAWITGFCKWVLDETDPFPNGYQMGDIW